MKCRTDFMWYWQNIMRNWSGWSFSRKQITIFALNTTQPHTNKNFYRRFLRIFHTQFWGEWTEEDARRVEQGGGKGSRWGECWQWPVMESVSDRILGMYRDGWGGGMQPRQSPNPRMPLSHPRSASGYKMLPPPPHSGFSPAQPFSHSRPTTPQDLNRRHTSYSTLHLRSLNRRNLTSEKMRPNIPVCNTIFQTVPVTVDSTRVMTSVLQSPAKAVS